jgi:TonB family protein
MRLAILLLMALGLSHAQEISHSNPPILVHRAEPEYTKEALAAKLQGVVILSTVIGVDGIPSEILVTRGLGMGLDEKAVECLKQWRFKPATHYDEPIPRKVSVEMSFRLPFTAH